MKYAYACPTHGIIETPVAADSIVCLDDGCGTTARRVWAFAVDKSSLKHRGRWDPIVGAYVRNEGEFKSLLHAGQERESEELGMDVRLETLDARDKEGLAELHGHTVAERDNYAEQTAKVKHDSAVS